MPNETVTPADVAALIYSIRNWEGNIDLDPSDLIEDAATALEALSAENERLRKALEPFAREAAEWWWKFGDDQKVSCRPGPPHDENEVAQFTVGDLRAARRALEGGE